jgi:hypothetical protein
MKKAKETMVLLAVLAAARASGCTSTAYMGIVTPHDAVEVLSDNVQVFEGPTYDSAVAQAGEAGFEVILSYEGRNMAFIGITGSVRVIAKDADGIRPSAAVDAAGVSEQGGGE